jgi:hypothetical protein
MPRSSLAREPEPERDFLVERLDPDRPLLLFLLSAIRDHPVHHLLYGEIFIPIRFRLQTRVRLPETAGRVRPLRRDVLFAPWARPGPSIDASRLGRKLDPAAGRAPMRHPGVPRGVPTERTGAN